WRNDEMNEQQLLSLANHLNTSRGEFVKSLLMIRDVLESLNENVKDFRVRMDAVLERVEEHFDESQLAAAGRMVEAQEKFTESALAVNDVTIALNERVKACNDIFSEQLDMITKHNESAKNILEFFPKFFAAFSETNLNTEATNRRLDALVEKMDIYFGSGTKGL